MAAPLAAQFQRQGRGMIAPAQGRALFRHVLSHADGQIGVLPHIQHRPEPLAHVPTLRADLEQLSDHERLHRLVAWLRREVASVLLLDRPERVELQQPLFELGLDSLMAVELRNRLSTQLDLPLHATLIFEYPTIDRLAPWLLDHLHLSKNGLAASGTAQAPLQAPARLETHGGVQDIAEATDAELLAFINQKFGEVS